MTDVPPPSADDPLDRATDALRRTDVPDGPPSETVARTLAALGAAADAPPLPLTRRKPMLHVWKIAVAGLLAASVVLAFIGILPSRPSLVFAEVAAKLRDARTLTYRVTLINPKFKEPMKMKILFKEPDHLRSESAGQVSIFDRRHNKMLILNSGNKTAVLIELKKTAAAPEDMRENPFEQFDRLRKLADQKSESLGKKRIGAVEAEGFRIEDKGQKINLWADPKSKMPVLLEMSVRVGEDENRITLDDFRLDPPLDDALFKLEIPEGYKRKTMEIDEVVPEEAVVRLLRGYAEKFDGKFPSALGPSSPDWEKYIKTRWGDKKPKGPPAKDFMQFMQWTVRVEMTRLTHKEFGYKPNGAKLGDRDKIVFWYRPDKADKYRAVYGDLHIADVTADQLPEQPKN